MTTVSTADFSLAQFLEHCRQRVERALREQLEVTAQAAGLSDAMAYATLGGGKRLRPVLVYGAARAMGCALPRADRAALAVELVHCYSLVHDDLPAMDDDHLRRGKPTVHKAYDEATAILVGDALLTLAFAVLADGGQSGRTAEDCLDMVGVLARAAGHHGMVAGQALDFQAAGATLDAAQLQAMHALKTGALISASVELGALCADNRLPQQLAQLRQYAEKAGLAFQIQDDVLDVIGDTDTLGKPQGSDQAMNKPTYTTLLGLDEARRQAAELADQAIDALRDFGAEADMLRQLATYMVHRVN